MTVSIRWQGDGPPTQKRNDTANNVIYSLKVVGGKLLCH